MNTRDIELPPLPYPQIPGNDYTAKDMQAYATAAIEADRQARKVEKAWHTSGPVSNGGLDPRNANNRQARDEPVAWSILDKRTGKHWYTHDSKYTAQRYANEYSHRESDGTQSMVVEPLYTAPQPPQIPEGYKLVPIEPTIEMMHASRDWSYKKYGKPIGNDAAIECYKAMLESAPEHSPARERL